MSARMVDKKEKKDQIIMAAIGEFAKKGFSRTTINDIARAARIGKGTVYEYFSNKGQIVHESFRFFLRLTEPDIQEALISDVPAAEKMIRLFDAHSGLAASEHADLMELMFEFWSEGIKDKGAKGLIFQEMVRFYSVYREIFADIVIEGMSDGSFRKDVNPRSVAAIIVGALDGFMVQWLLENDKLDFADIIKTLKTLVLKGLEAE